LHQAKRVEGTALLKLAAFCTHSIGIVHNFGIRSKSFLEKAICVVKIFRPNQKCIEEPKQYFYNNRTDKHWFANHHRVTKTRFSRLQAGHSDDNQFSQSTKRESLTQLCADKAKWFLTKLMLDLP
jgi:hypothetical protein